MTPAPDDQHRRNPYPPDVPTRLAVVEERLDNLEEHQLARTMGELVTETRLMRQQLENTERANLAWQQGQDRRLAEIEAANRAQADRLKALEDAAKVRTGVVLTWRTAVALLPAVLALLTILVMIQNWPGQ